MCCIQFPFCSDFNQIFFQNNNYHIARQKSHLKITMTKLSTNNGLIISYCFICFHLKKVYYIFVLWKSDMITSNSEVSTIYLNENIASCDRIFSSVFWLLKGMSLLILFFIILLITYRAMERKYKKEKLVYQISVWKNNRIANGKKEKCSPMLNLRWCW